MTFYNRIWRACIIGTNHIDTLDLQIKACTFWSDLNHGFMVKSCGYTFQHFFEVIIRFQINHGCDYNIINWHGD